MGALSYEPQKNKQDLGLNNIVLDDLASQSQKILEGSSGDMVDELLLLGSSSAGARPKVLVQISDDKNSIIHGQQELKDGYSHYIVKFASSIDNKEIGAIEYIYMQMAKEAGLNVPETLLLQGKTRRYFATQRFDRTKDAQVHMHSVAGLIHSDFRLPTLDYDDLLNLTVHLTKNIQEQKKMYRLACFNLFSHNRDDHAKNFSFLMDDKGVWRLSPVYDVTFSYGPGGEHSTTYLGEGKYPSKESLIKLGQKHKIKNYIQIINEVSEAILKWDFFAKDMELSSYSTKEISKKLESIR
ncbi:HIPA PROTEIN [hydrothermal vent metagenome]|uniref:HIPA PROTEIN n=1 Tax=hydrothermal vent metagenome TaxID=652676 RepID=A0A3B1DTH2_9ZZZZ